ncbi:MAG: hypothetical protein CW338_03190, partial [Clostridiales bacterium]|nr:hypothetical protein [Clostridiales bacterium]
MMDKKYIEIPAEKFAFAQRDEKIHDKKIATKPVGYFKDAWRRFRKNKSAVVAFVLIMILVMFSIFVPVFSSYSVKFRDDYYQKTLPKSHIFGWLGWDGTRTLNANQDKYDILCSLNEEIVPKDGESRRVITSEKAPVYDANGLPYYDVTYDTYFRVGTVYKNMTETEYLALQAYQNETGIQV